MRRQRHANLFLFFAKNSKFIYLKQKINRWQASVEALCTSSLPSHPFIVCSASSMSNIIGVSLVLAMRETKRTSFVLQKFYFIYKIYIMYAFTSIKFFPDDDQ